MPTTPQSDPYTTVRLPDQDPPGPRGTPARRPRRRGPLIAAIVGGVVLLAAGGTVAAIAFGVSRAGALQSRPVTETFAGAREIVVDLDEGAVRLTAAPGPDVEVRTIPAWASGYEPTTSRTLTGGVLTVRGDCPDFDLGCEVDEEIAVPAGVRVRVSTVDGAVTATGLDVPRFAADTVNGGVDVAFGRAPAQVALETVNGSVVLTVPPDRYRVSTSTVIGSVTTGVPDDPGATSTLDLQTVNGAITVRSS